MIKESEKTGLIDSFGRVHTNMRISVTDRCNIRCFYCMPNEDVQFKPKDELLTFEEIGRIVEIAAGLGIRSIRLTGGEPLVRAELPNLIHQLAGIQGIDDVALTTNGILLADQAEALKRAGLNRINISLDTLREESFRRIARRDGLDRVLEGIAAAQRVGFEKIRLNAIAMRDLTEEEILPLANFARQRGLELRFIEFMPLDAEHNWTSDQVLSGEEIRHRLEESFGKLVPSPRTNPSQPAVDYTFAEGGGSIGLISPVTEPFCHTCNRLRLTAEGCLRNCLFSTTEWDVRDLVRHGASDASIATLFHDCVAAKKSGHGIDSPDFLPPERAMYQIGG